MATDLSVWPSLLRAGAFKTLHGGHPGEPNVGLTIPMTTPAELSQTLSILQEHKQTRATLLIWPALALSVPDLLLQATAQGHELAGTGPLRHLTLLEAAAGQPVQHWALLGHDLTGPNLHELARAGLRPLPELPATPQPGGLMLAHPASLPQTLSELRRLGYQPGTVRDLPGLRSAQPRDLFVHEYIRRFEEPYAQQQKMIDLSAAAHAVMRIAPLNHAPAPLPLPPGTPTAELHVNSARLVGLTSRSLIGTYRTYQRNLRDVGQAMQTRPELADAQAIFAVTLLYPVLEKAGFELLELPPLTARWYGLGFRLLRIAYGTTSAPSDPLPKMAWLPREEFLKRYG